MKQLNAEAKHHILLEYAPHDATRSFTALARRHGVTGGARLLRLWYSRWDGSPAPLQHRHGAGRPRTFSRQQVQQHIRTPILRSNRTARTVKYTELLPRVQQNSGTQISLRTLQRYGKEELGARCTRGKKRTAEERELLHIHRIRHACLLRVLYTHKVFCSACAFSVC